MENNINKQDNQNNMDNNKKYLKQFIALGLFLWILVLSFQSVFGVEEQTHLLWYPVESSSITTIFDMSGNNINSILVNGAIPQTTNLIWGTRNLFCDGVNDYAISTLFHLTPQYSVSLWVRPVLSVTKDYWTTIDDGSVSAFELEYDGTNSILELGYYNNSGNYTHRNIDNVVFPSNTWQHIVVTIDSDNDRYSYYKNGQAIIVNGIFPDGYSFNENLSKDVHLCINRDFNFSKMFNGKIDEYRIFNFELNPIQVSELFNTNTITFQQINETPVIETPASLVNTNLINSTSITPNQIFNNQDVSLIVILNNVSTNCEIYYDYELYDTSTNLLSFMSPKTFEFGNHNYYLYCEKNQDGIKYYDLTDVIPFSVQKGSKAIEFYFFDQNEQFILGEDYYLSTPCFENHIQSSSWIKDNSYYLKNLVNGYAQFNLSYTQDYEFCLYRGTINLNEQIDNYTKQFDVVQIKKEIELGNIFIGENTTSYKLNLDDKDKFGVSEPEYWGKDRNYFGGLFLGLIVGGILILIGYLAKSEKLIVIGGLVIMAGFGVTGFQLVGLLF